MYWYLAIGAAVAIGAAAVGGYHTGRKNGMAEVQQVWDKEKTAQYTQYAKAMEESVEIQQKLQMGADKLRQEKDREIRDITARNTALANSLRDRQSRSSADSSAVSGAASVRQNACTGAQLYREDGEFLAGLAREADEIRLALKQCYAQYDAVRQTVK